ncbi:hypothetical protein [Amycolatopsis sp. CA-128772]|uniref:hypothetical protein n=1 Tax=Amycolatopsis sp. CA-128772 TaxID=2073159 RepID=UPI000CD26D6F|nr:hypothetical protein [Amycolatopsis sp. CA-128772]
MTDYPCTVEHCDRPAGADAFVCPRCTNALFRDLVSVRWLVDQLAVTLARLDRLGGPAGAGDGGEPMPAYYPAVQAFSTLLHTVQPWAHSVAERTRTPLAVANHPWPLARWLAGNVDAVRGMTDGGQLAGEIRYAVTVTRGVIDRPPDLFYAGPCTACGVDLYCHADNRGRPAVAVIRCRGCGEQYDTVKRREWLLNAVEDRIASLSEIARAVPAVAGREIRFGTLRVWVNRGRLVPRAWLHNGQVYAQRQSSKDRPLCRIGDVLDLIGKHD